MCFIVYITRTKIIQSTCDTYRDEPPLYQEDTYLYPLYHHFFKVYNRRLHINYRYCSL